MTVLDRSELQASPLSDLHLIASQVGVEGFRRLRKAELIDAILSHQSGDGEQTGSRSARTRRPRSSRSRSTQESIGEPFAEDREAPEEDSKALREDREAPEEDSKALREDRKAPGEDPKAPAAARRSRGRAAELEPRASGRGAEGVVEVLGNGSAFLRLNHPDSSDEDVYVSAAQVRRCELVSGDTVSGPVRPPRRSERYPSLIRVEAINGQPADSVVEGTRYDELPVSWPSERFSFEADDPTLQAIEWLTPIGRGSRALIVGGARAGKSETLRRMLNALAGREGLQPMLVLAGVRPEEISDWLQGPLPALAALSFAASADAQGQAVESAIESAKRLAARGEHALVAIDSLDGLHPHTARRVLAAARKLREGGSLTVLATASRPFGGETTVIALDTASASAGRFPALDLASSGTLRPELLVGEEGAQAIAKARAAAAES